MLIRLFSSFSSYTCFPSLGLTAYHYSCRPIVFITQCCCFSPARATQKSFPSTHVSLAVFWEIGHSFYQHCGSWRPEWTCHHRLRLSLLSDTENLPLRNPAIIRAKNHTSSSKPVWTARLPAGSRLCQTVPHPVIMAKVCPSKPSTPLALSLYFKQLLHSCPRECS